MKNGFARTTKICASILTIACVSAAATTPVLAQDESVIYPPGSFRAPASGAQARQCHFLALTRDIEVDSGQAAAIRRAIEQFKDTTPPRARNAAEWAPRFARRDSLIRLTLRNARDSSRFESNRRTERQWFESGQCNGPQRRPE